MKIIESIKRERKKGDVVGLMNKFLLDNYGNNEREIKFRLRVHFDFFFFLMEEVQQER